MRSESTRAFGQPSETKEMRGGRFISASWPGVPPIARPAHGRCADWAFACALET
jgi:hypothetical protein